jgi:hypothetical protein
VIETVREVLRGDTRKGARAVQALFKGSDDTDARIGARLVTLALLRIIGPEGGDG